MSDAYSDRASRQVIGPNRTYNYLDIDTAFLVAVIV